MNQDQLREQIREALGSVQDLIAVNTSRQVHYRLSSAVEAVAAVVAPLLAERRAVEQRLIGELADTRGRLGETQGSHWAARERLEQAEVEVVWLRREVEFEANAVQTGGEWFGFDEPPRVCCCLTPEGAAQVAAQPEWTLPQCSVHPEGGETDG